MANRTKWRLSEPLSNRGVKFQRFVGEGVTPQAVKTLCLEGESQVQFARHLSYSCFLRAISRSCVSTPTAHKQREA